MESFSHIHCRRKIIYIIDIPFQISEKGYENVLLNKSKSFKSIDLKFSTNKTNLEFY